MSRCLLIDVFSKTETVIMFKFQDPRFQSQGSDHAETIHPADSNYLTLANGEQLQAVSDVDSINSLQDMDVESGCSTKQLKRQNTEKSAMSETNSHTTLFEEKMYNDMPLPKISVTSIGRYASIDEGDGESVSLSHAEVSDVMYAQ